jgi:hypothetical protein
MRCSRPPGAPQRSRQSARYSSRYLLARGIAQKRRQVCVGRQPKSGRPARTRRLMDQSARPALPRVRSNAPGHCSNCLKQRPTRLREDPSCHRSRYIRPYRTSIGADGPQPNIFARTSAVAICPPDCWQIASRRNQKGSKPAQPHGPYARTGRSALDAMPIPDHGQPPGFGRDLLGPAACGPTEPITLRDKLACVWKQLLAAPSQISVTVDLRSMTK